MAKEANSKGKSNGIQILLVLAAGAFLIFFMNAKVKAGHHTRPADVTAAPDVDMRASPGGFFEKITGGKPTRDKLDKRDRQELDDLINKVGK